MSLGKASITLIYIHTQVHMHVRTQYVPVRGSVHSYLYRPTTISGSGTTTAKDLNHNYKLTWIWAVVELQKLNSLQIWSGLFCKTTWSSTSTCYSVGAYRSVYTHHIGLQKLPNQRKVLCYKRVTLYLQQGKVCMWNNGMMGERGGVWKQWGEGFAQTGWCTGEDGHICTSVE